MEQQIIIENGGEQGIQNYSAVVAMARERVKNYEGLIIPESAIAEAKTEVADLRRTAKKASDLRIAIKKEHDAKIEKTISQLKEITDIYNHAADAIDSQVKEYAQKVADAKKAEIEAYFDSVVGKMKPFLPLTAIWNPKWLNKTYDTSAIMNEINSAISTAVSGMRAILEMHTPHESTLLRIFFSTLSLEKVMEEKQKLDDQEIELARVREEREREKAERQKVAEISNNSTQETFSAPQCTVEPPKEENPVQTDFKVYTLTFRVTATKPQILKLREFLVTNNIQFQKGE